MPRYDQLLTPAYTEDAIPGEELELTEQAPQPTPAVSGNAQLHLDAIANARPSSPRSIVRWQSPDQFARDLTLFVNVQTLAGNTAARPYASEGAFLAQGDGNGLGDGAATELGGVLRLTYGFGAALRVLEADLQSGTYAVPACNSLEVGAYLWLQGAADANVFAAIVPGQVQSPARLHNSQRTTLGAGANATIQVPFGARWVSLAGGEAGGIGSGQPQVSLRQGRSGPLLLQDWANSVFIGGPGVPIELANRDDLVITNLGSAAATYTVRFYLEW